MKVGLFGPGLPSIRRVPPTGAAPPPAAPTLTAPAASANVFNTVAVTVSATSSDGDLDRIDWVLDPGGGEVIVATDASAPYSQSWTPTGITLGAHTLVARSVRGGLHTDSASITINVGEVIWVQVASFTCLRGWQSDFGITTGGTPLASGIGPPPALTLTGSVTGVQALRVEIQTTGADGVATYRYGALNTGTTSVTWIEQNKVVPGGGGAYAAIGELAGLTFNWPAGAYTNDNVYQGTCSAWVDQKNGFSAAQATASKQPLILWDTVTGRFFLRFDGVDDFLLEPNLDLPAPNATPVLIHSIFKQRTWAANRALYASGTTGGTTQLTGQTATPQLKGFNSGSFTTGVSATLGTLFRGEGLFTGSVNDRLKIGGTNVSTINTGAGNPAAGFIIGAASTSAVNAGAFDVYAVNLFNGNPTELAAIDTILGVMYAGIVV